uniref:Uncharacterized protein n=1 Tax=Trypanosoma vivax (strain Y486) TaxID=1055687 RepID=G0U7H5_TRYVY|nr:hypothetical protein, unlikely [Trypanosoma vivax Y486]
MVEGGQSVTTFGAEATARVRPRLTPIITKQKKTPCGHKGDHIPLRQFPRSHAHIFLPSHTAPSTPRVSLFFRFPPGPVRSSTHHLSLCVFPNPLLSLSSPSTPPPLHAHSCFFFFACPPFHHVLSFSLSLSLSLSLSPFLFISFLLVRGEEGSSPPPSLFFFLVKILFSSLLVFLWP